MGMRKKRETEGEKENGKTEGSRERKDHPSAQDYVHWESSVEFSFFIF